MISLFIILSGILLSQNQHPLSEFQWNYRVIILSGEESMVKQQLELYKKRTYDLTDRDLVIIYSLSEKLQFYPKRPLPSVAKEKLDKYYNLNDKERFKSLLIGKDGRIKETDKEIIPADKYIQAIDAMPMRISEMKKNGGKNQ